MSFYNQSINLERIGPKLLHYFWAVAEELSFSKAALRLNMSQPPLSLHIKELETLLETKLFQRSTRSVKLTPAGEVLLKEVQRIRHITQQSLRHVSQMGRGVAGHIKLGIVGTAVWGKLLQSLQNFTQTYPDVSWSIEEIPPHKQIDALLTHSIDVGVWRQAEQNQLPSTLSRQLLQEEKLVVAVPKGHHLAKRGLPIALETLKDEQLIGWAQDNYSVGNQVIETYQSHGITPDFIHAVREPQTALALVGNGYGVTLLPESYSNIIWPDVLFYPLVEEVKANLYLVTNSSDEIPLIHEFLSNCRTKTYGLF